MSDYTVEDIQHAWRVGFEAGVYYTFGHIDPSKLSDRELLQLANWIELKRPWKNMDEWYELIKKAQGRVSKNG